MAVENQLEEELRLVLKKINKFNRPSIRRQLLKEAIEISGAYLGMKVEITEIETEK